MELHAFADTQLSWHALHCLNKVNPRHLLCIHCLWVLCTRNVSRGQISWSEFLWQTRIRSHAYVHKRTQGNFWRWYISLCIDYDNGFMVYTYLKLVKLYILIMYNFFACQKFLIYNKPLVQHLLTIFFCIFPLLSVINCYGFFLRRYLWLLVVEI